MIAPIKPTINPASCLRENAVLNRSTAIMTVKRGVSELSMPVMPDASSVWAEVNK